MSTTETLGNTERSEEDATSLLTIAEVCAELRISRTTVWRLVRSGDLVAFRLSRNCVRITAASLEDYMVQHRVAPMRGKYPPRTWAATHRSPMREATP